MRLVFRGECLEGHDPQSVREAVARALKLDEQRAQRLFSGKPIVLRRQMDSVAAYRLIVRFAQLGARVYAEPARPPVASARAGSRTPRPVRAPATVPAVARVGQASGWPPGLPGPHPAAAPTAAAAPQRARPWTPLQWAAIGVLGPCAAIVLGLALGPGLSTLWPHPAEPGEAGATVGERSAPRTAMAVPTVPLLARDGQVAEPAEPDAPAQATAEEEAEASLPRGARQDYRQRYLAAPEHKAFAVSTRGAHAWHAGAGTRNEARDRALADCMAALQPGDEGCRIVDADGEWLE